MSHGTFGSRPKRSPFRPIAVVVAVALVAAAWWQITSIEADLEEHTVVSDDVPVTLLLPRGDVQAPGVVVVHGFGGSKVLMRSWAISLTRAGFAVALPDLAGHGSSTVALARTDDLDQLSGGVRVALELLQAQPRVDAQRLGLLGHSMGSGAVMQAGLDAPETVGAVVAVSPTDAGVTPTSPANLLLLAGSREPRFVANAEDLLARAGGAGGAFEEGTARRLRVIDGVEHVSILFSPAAHEASIAWLAESLGHDPSPSSRALPIVWWALHLVGVVMLWRVGAPLLVEPHVVDDVRRGRPLVGALGGGLAATIGLAGVGAVVAIDQLGGMLVGPVLVLWFAIAGVVWLALGTRPGLPEARDLGWALVLLAVLVVAFGLLGARVWLPWWPHARRVVAMPVFALLLLPWTLALSASLQGRRGVRAVGWWLAISLVLLATLGAAASVVAGLGFVALLLPLLPAVLALTMVVSAPLQRPWAAGLATAGFLGWTIAVLFPLV